MKRPFLLVTFFLVFCVLPLTCAAAEPDIFSGLSVNMPVKIGSNPFSWEGKLEIGEIDLINAVFRRGENLLFKAGSAGAAPLADVSWYINSTEYVAAFEGTVEPVVDKPYPTYFNGEYQPGQGGGSGTRDLSWSASAMGFAGTDIPDHTYWNVYILQNNAYFSLVVNGQSNWNVQDEPFTVNFRASNTKNHMNLLDQVVADCAAKAIALGKPAIAGAGGFFRVDQNTWKLVPGATPIGLASAPQCDQCVDNTYVQRWLVDIDIDVSTYVCYPEWNQDNANAITTIAWKDFAGRVKTHEYKHYENYAKILGAFISKYGGKEWHIRACFGPSDHAKAKKAIEDYRESLVKQFHDDWQKAQDERAAEDEKVKNHPVFGDAATGVILSSTTLMTSDNP